LSTSADRSVAAPGSPGRSFHVAPIVTLAIAWCIAFDYCLRSLDLRNDQFGRISPGWQILTFGELPFRDFLDPGYFLTEYSSAFMQWLFGQNLLGELLLDSVFIATGCSCVYLVARRLTGSVTPALAAAGFALLAVPRAYDYDKALFYSLGLIVLFRWLDQPTRRRAVALAATLVAAAMYRYDNGVFLGAAAVAGALVRWWGDRKRLIAAAGFVAAITLALSTPVLLFLHFEGGLANAADQALTYGLREGARTRIGSPLPVRLGQFVRFVPPPASGNHVRVRWAPSVASAIERRQLQVQLGLADEQPAGAPGSRTWLYTLPDGSRASVRRLVTHPSVEDTDGIDRSRLRLLQPESWWLRVQRASPLFRIRIFPAAWTVENAEAVIYYALFTIPAIALLVLVVRRRALTALARADLAAVLTLCVLLCAFILREPVSARVGGMAGPFCAVAAWLLTSLTARAPRSGRIVTVAAVSIAAVCLALAVEWHHQVSVPFADPATLRGRLTAFAKTPPSLDLLPSGRLRGMVEYVRACTSAHDRVFTTWFSPELFYFAQRGFGGGIAASFGGHWSEPRFQRRTIAALESYPTPLVIMHSRDDREFRDTYPLVAGYVTSRYRLAGVTDFGDPEAAADEYSVFVRGDRTIAGTAGPYGMPCLVATAPL
jgi:hypothetical protein